MRDKIRQAGVVTALAAAALLGTAAGGASAADRIGPFAQLSECLRAGNQGVDDGRWSDYECKGQPPAIYLYPEY